MIKVNLLPPEYRKVDGTPVARFIALLLGVFMTASALSGWAYVHFGMLSEVRGQREQLEQDRLQLRALADRSEALAKEFTEYQKRRDTIEAIGASRVLWSKKLDELGDVINANGDAKRHLVWLNSIRTAGGGGRKGSGGKLEIRGVSGGLEMSRLSDFHKDLKDDPDFFADFERIDPPAGRRKPFTDGRIPEFGWEFNFGIELKVNDPKKKK